MIKVYAGGSCAKMEDKESGGEWRGDLPHISGVEWFFPTRPPNASKENNFLPSFYIIQDLVHINMCDILLFVFEEGAKVPQHGTCTEIGIGYAKGIPTIAVCPDDMVRASFSFPLSLIPSVVSTLDEAFEIIRFAANGK